jgi:hypothetical protein
MSPDDYVAAVLKRYELPTGPDSPAEKATEELGRLITAWAGRYLMSLTTTGSYAKGTRVRGSTDLDLLVSLGPRTKGGPHQIYDCMFAWLKSKRFNPRTRNIGITIQYKGLIVDIIPARMEWGSTNDHSVFETERGHATRTNFDRHVKFIRESKRIEEIRAAKIWRDLLNLRFPSFYLELAVLDAVKHRAHHQPAENLTAILEYFSTMLVSVPFRDPANFNNKVSSELTEHEQMAVATAAAATLKKSDWDRVIW